MKLFEMLRFKCKRHEMGCKKVLKGQNFDIQKHENNECEWRHLDQLPDKDLSVNCSKCHKRLIPEGFESNDSLIEHIVPMKKLHVCNDRQN